MLRSALLVLCGLTLIANVVRADEKELAKEKGEGFVSLFDGKTLEGWQGATKEYVVEDGMLVCKGGKLFTKKEYSDFVIRFEFKLPAGGNNGLGLRAPLEGDPAYAGMEVQILDDNDEQYAKLKPYQYCGSVYGVAPAKRGFVKKPGDWNVEEVSVHGTKVKVTLNGEVIVDTDIAEAIEKGTLDGNQHPGLKRKSGFVGFLGHGSPVAFRNIRIKELK